MNVSIYPGAGGSVGGGSADGSTGELYQVTYFGPSIVMEKETFTLTCILSIYDLLKWTHNGLTIKSGDGG